MSDSPYESLCHAVSDASLISATSSILSWDQETQMPEQGVELRSRQMAQLAKLAHEMGTKPQILHLIDRAEGCAEVAGDPAKAANVREMRRDFERKIKLPSRLVEELARVSSAAQHEWAGARKDSDFKRFLPHLTRLVELNREQADCLGVPEGGERWDALADLYEPGCRATMVSGVFAPLRTRLVALIDRIKGASRGPSDRFNQTAFPIERQRELVRWVSEQIGFDFTRGRLDQSTHPFCGGSHCRDVRMTTRYKETCVNDALGSTMHEAGHGMYEQGLPFSQVGTPLGEAVSLGIHESQSRMWENQVGRSRQFWSWIAPQLPSRIGDPASTFSVDELYGAANIVEPSFIRVEADEATYNLHVMVRFELERALIGGTLEPCDLPGAWNEKYRDYLGLEVPEDRVGCLQDVHWSMGAFGYFPTYTLGTLYAAQFFDTACAGNPGLVEGFTRGQFSPLLAWLQQNIHRHGRRYGPGELCELVTGKPLSAEHFLRYLEGKLAPLYGL
ncbi:MAG: carboxypeptidase M32 [Planctomycetota bacterium]|nr:carboxypeptidase M32 [Planctomycetota bacterium]MDA1105090.1 carboxypeptidase M32 [Planctomycetota bacterium]